MLQSRGYNMAITVDEDRVVVTATNKVGKGALGSEQRAARLSDIQGVELVEPTMLKNGSIRWVDKDGAVIFHFLRKHREEARAVFDVMAGTAPVVDGRIGVLDSSRKQPKQLTDVIVYIVHDEEPFQFEVVGESHHRDHLFELIAAAPDDERAEGEVFILADLVPEPTNAFDPDAIAVYIAGGQVGYISARDAGDVRDVLDDAYARGATRILVPAVIGWNTNNPNPPIGVRLSLPDEDLTLARVLLADEVSDSVLRVRG